MGKNRLSKSDSPYLLKHASNPVDWYEWGDEALEKSKKEDKLIFLSIGYTACHWCNELEKEAFEHQEFADAINDRFVSIKVDREQRPDLDAIYMQAAMALQGRGGWPNNVFLTPDLDPVFALGFQKRDVFIDILNKLHDFWGKNRASVVEGSERLSKALKDSLEGGGVYPKSESLDLSSIKSVMDDDFGGFGDQTKFPLTPVLEFLLTEGKDDDFMRVTLDNMARGGMYDHVGGGFHRYSTDPKWEIPHFEKMMYDNALLASLYVRAANIYDEPEYEQVVRDTLDFMVRELSTPEGGFLSSLDADSEGKEGKYYTWAYDEVEKIAGADKTFMKDYSLTRDGNMYDIIVTDSGPRQVFTKESTLRRKGANRHKETLQKLFDARSERVRPPLDDKVVASWHGLAVSAFARAGIGFQDPALIEIAEKGARFTLDRLKFNHTWRQGKVGGEANLNDHAYAAMAFWDLFEATGKNEYLEAAKQYVDRAKDRFTAGDGGYYLVTDSDDLIARPRVADDNPLPSASAVLARVDWRLSKVLDDPQRESAARATANHLLGTLGGASLYSGESMSLFREINSKQIEVVYAFGPGENGKAEWLAKGAAREWGILRVTLGADSISESLSEGRYPTDKSMAYVCMNQVCLAPSTTPDDVTLKLKEIGENWDDKSS